MSRLDFASAIAVAGSILIASTAAGLAQDVRKSVPAAALRR